MNAPRRTGYDTKGPGTGPVLLKRTAPRAEEPSNGRRSARLPPASACPRGPSAPARGESALHCAQGARPCVLARPRVRGRPSSWTHPRGAAPCLLDGGEVVSVLVQMIADGGHHEVQLAGRLPCRDAAARGLAPCFGGDARRRDEHEPELDDHAEDHGVASVSLLSSGIMPLVTPALSWPGSGSRPLARSSFV